VTSIVIKSLITST